MTDKEAVKLVHEAIELGCNFFDTAPNYGLGKSESILGEAFKGRRDEVIINSKCGHHTDDVQSFDPKRLIESVVQAVSQLIAGVKQSASEVHDASTQLSAVAEETSKATTETAQMIDEVSQGSHDAVSAMNESKRATERQADVIKQTTSRFTSLASENEKVMSAVETITTDVLDINAYKDDIVKAISQIAAILEETTAATEEVDASSAEQLQALKMVTESAESLQQNGELLDLK
jgi:aryl-alcohol dehydrogenase-like predicted oxidoreductase